MPFDLVAKSPVERRVAQIVEPVLVKMGFELVRVRLFANTSTTLQIMVDKLGGGIHINDCAEISNTLRLILEVEKVVLENYVTEVSSPGLDRPLTRRKDFSDFEGWEAKIEIFKPVDGRRRFRGVLAGIENDEVLLTVSEETIGLKLDWLSDAKLVITEDLLTGRRKGKTDGETRKV